MGTTSPMVSLRPAHRDSSPAGCAAGGERLPSSAAFLARIAASCADALVEPEAVVVAVPGYGYRHVLDAAAPFLRSEQVVVFSSHMSLAALYLAGLLRKRGVDPADRGASARPSPPGGRPDLTLVNVSSVRARLDVAVMPDSAANRGMEVCRALFGDRFVARDGLLAIALSNLHPQKPSGDSNVQPHPHGTR